MNQEKKTLTKKGEMMWSQKHERNCKKYEYVTPSNKSDHRIPSELV